MTSSINKICLIGNLGKDAEMRQTTGGASYCHFSMATSERRKQGEQWIEETEWHTIKVWGKSAPRAAELKKGGSVYVEGRLSSYEVNGQRRWEVIAYCWKNLTTKSDHLLPPDPPQRSAWSATPGGWS